MFKSSIKLLLSLLFVPWAAMASEFGTIHNTEQFELASRHVGDTFKIQVGLPENYGVGKKAYKLLYVLDGNAAFGMTVDLTRLLPQDIVEPGFPELIVVAIGYTDPALRAIFRTRDMTPENSVPQTMIEYFKSAAPGFEKYAGGADQFLSFIEEELDPLIRKTYRVKGKKAGLMGDSFGGLFSYYAFLKQSSVFDRYWMGSPGLNIEGNHLVSDLLPILQKGKFKDTRIFLTLGAREKDNNFHTPAAQNYEHIVRAFAENPKKGLSIGSHVYEGKTHITVIPEALAQALLYLYK